MEIRTLLPIHSELSYDDDVVKCWEFHTGRHAPPSQVGEQVGVTALPSPSREHSSWSKEGSLGTGIVPALSTQQLNEPVEMSSGQHINESPHWMVRAPCAQISKSPLQTEVQTVT